MPWEKTFDLDAAVDRATAVFWKKGYDATSMADLIEAMQINKGSLYNAFGSKKALFDRALARYDQKNRARIIADLRKMPDAVAAITTLFDGLIAEAKGDREHLGCFVVNTALDLPNQPPEVAEVIRASLADIEAFFNEAIKKGQAKGQISAKVNPVQTSQALLSMLVGLRVLARGGVDSSSLASVRDGALHLINPK